MKKFFNQLNNAVLGGLSAFIFFVLGFLWWIFDANTLVQMWVLSAIIIVCYLICIIVYGICSIKNDAPLYRLPAVKSINKANSKLIFVTEKNDLFNQGSYATICYQDDEEGLEVVVGLGYVQTITSAGCLQIELLRIINSDTVKEIYDRIENKKTYRNAIKIKPSVYSEFIEEGLLND